MENITNNLDKCPVCGKKKSSKFEACYLCRMATLNLENSKVNPNYSLENYNSVRIKDPQHIVELIRDGVVSAFEMEMRRKSGELFWVVANEGAR